MNNQYRKMMLLTSGVIILAMIALSAWAWFQLPEGAQLPVHWGLNGQPDRYGSKAEGLLLTPAIGVLLLGLQAIIPAIDPRGENIRRSAKPYYIFWLAIGVVLLIVHALLVFAALGHEVNMGSGVIITIGLLFMVIGNYLGKIRSNFMIGIRTPWTLSSELAWNKTHRLGGKLFMLTGGLMIVAGLLGQFNLAFIVTMVGAVGLSIGLAIYSYFVWRGDPARVSQ